MRLNELNTEFETHRVITYNTDGNKAVYHNVRIRPVEGRLYVGNRTPDEYGQDYCTCYVLFDDVNIGIEISKYRADTEVDLVMRDVNIRGLENLETFLDRARSIIEAGTWLTLLEVALLENVAPELVDGAHEARRIYRQRMEEKRIAREQRMKEEDAEYVKRQNEKTYEDIQKAIDVLINGGVLNNNVFTIYHGRYNGKNYCMVGYLMEKYKINMPIRTVGWVNNSLASVVINGDGSIGGMQYYKRGKSKGSTSIWKYMERMIAEARTNTKAGENNEG